MSMEQTYAQQRFSSKVMGPYLRTMLGSRNRLGEQTNKQTKKKIQKYRSMSEKEDPLTSLGGIKTAENLCLANYRTGYCHK